MDLNARDWATLTWVLLVATWLLTWGKTRKPIVQAGKRMLSALASGELTVAVGGYVLWLEGCLILARHLGVWDFALAKDAIAWFVVGGLPLFAKFAKPHEPRALRKELLRAVTLPALVAFIYGTVSLPFWIEFVSLPILALCSMMVVYSSYHHEADQAGGLAQRMLTVLALCLFGLTAVQFVASLGSLDGPHLVLAFYLPLWLTAMAYPYVWFMRRYTKRQQDRVWHRRIERGGSAS